MITIILSIIILILLIFIIAVVRMSYKYNYDIRKENDQLKEEIKLLQEENLILTNDLTIEFERAECIAYNSGQITIREYLEMCYNKRGVNNEPK